MPTKIKTNNKPRHIIYGYELTEKQRKEFDYLDSEELDSSSFFQYHGWIYCLDEFERAPEDLKPWDGIKSELWYSGIVIRIVDNGDSVIVGRYCD